MSNYVYIASSIDGYIASRDNGLDWLNEIPNPEQTDYGYSEFMHGIDAVVMGRNTFRTVAGFESWPYDVPVFVLSNSLRNVPEKLIGKAEIVNGDLNILVGKLGGRGYKNLYIDGGETIQSFFKENLIDDMTITWVPVLLGDGIPLFGSLSHEIKMTHKETKIFNNGLVQSRYTIPATPAAK